MSYADLAQLKLLVWSELGVTKKQLIHKSLNTMKEGNISSFRCSIGIKNNFYNFILKRELFKVKSNLNIDNSHLNQV